MEDSTMAKKVANNKGQREVTFAPGTRHSGVHPTLATLTRQPLAAIPATKTKADPKGDFLLNLLTEAGANGITWAAMQQALKEKFGAAPKKRHSLYAILHGRQWYKVTGQRGVVTYYLGREPKRRTRKTA
jgi:hypothetical protein